MLLRPIGRVCWNREQVSRVLCECPLPVVGPMTLLDESRVNHYGKQAFPFIYWNVLLPGRPLPLPAAMSMAGKSIPPETRTTGEDA